VIGASIARVQAADQEPTVEEVNATARDVGRHMRSAEEALARSLRATADGPDAPSEAKDAGVSLARLLAATRDDSRQAAAAMQWLVDHAPQ
jgi:hypothetical protein